MKYTKLIFKPIDRTPLEHIVFSCNLSFILGNYQTEFYLFSLFRNLHTYAESHVINFRLDLLSFC